MGLLFLVLHLIPTPTTPPAFSDRADEEPVIKEPKLYPLHQAQRHKSPRRHGHGDHSAPGEEREGE